MSADTLAVRMNDGTVEAISAKNVIVGGGKCFLELRRSAQARRLRLIVGSEGVTVVVPDL